MPRKKPDRLADRYNGKPSPGPWKTGPNTKRPILDADGRPVLRVDVGWEAGDECIDVSEGDLKLMVAAPVMLQLLEKWRGAAMIWDVPESLKDDTFDFFSSFETSVKK